MTPKRLISRIFMVLAALLAAPQGGLAQTRPDELPAEFQGVGVKEQLDIRLPLDLVFTDDNGRDRKLGDYFDGKKPVILTLNFYKCRSLCNAQLNGLLDALKQMKWTAGDQFDIVTLSFDPLEPWQLAREKKRSYIESYGRPAAAGGWHFLTGSKANIQTLTDAVGFTYRWNPETEQWAHSAAAILCTPDGRTSRYLGGIFHEPDTLRLSLVEASQGKVGSLWDKIFLTCFHYVSADGKYVPHAIAIVRLGGALTVVVLGLGLFGLWRFEAARRRAALQTAEVGGLAPQ